MLLAIFFSVIVIVIAICYRQHVNVDYYILIAVGATFVVLKVQYIVA